MKSEQSHQFPSLVTPENTLKPLTMDSLTKRMLRFNRVMDFRQEGISQASVHMHHNICQGISRLSSVWLVVFL